MFAFFLLLSFTAICVIAIYLYVATKLYNNGVCKDSGGHWILTNSKQIVPCFYMNQYVSSYGTVSYGLRCLQPFGR